MAKFTFITHKNTDPYFNIASEEYLLKQKDGFYVYLWRNAPSVIVGVNQNTLQEINFNYTAEKGIKIVRRQTGGGAVYHDENNVCFTIIAPYDAEIDGFKACSEPVLDCLNKMGVKAEFSGRNDITIDGKKISGNAETVYKDRVLHHGTLLFNTDMGELTKSLKVNKLKIESKGIKSVRKRVTNIYDELENKISVNEFMNNLIEYFIDYCDGVYEFSEIDIENINKLVKEKYSTYEWNIGYSPKGKISFNEKFPFGIFNLTFDLVDGKIKNPEIFGDFFTIKDISEFSKSLEGVKFIKSELLKAFSNIGDYIVKAKFCEIVEKLYF